MDITAQYKENNEVPSPNKTNNDEEKSELDGGLGSSVCDEDIRNHTNFNYVGTNQVQTGNVCRILRILGNATAIAPRK